MNSHRKVFSYILQINSILLRKCERKSLECSTWLVLIWLTTECNASFKSRTRLISFTTQGFQEDDENKGTGTSVFMASCTIYDTGYFQFISILLGFAAKK